MTANVATPKLGGAHADAIDSRDAGVPPTITLGPATILDPPTFAPSTLPMTPRMDAPAARTLASPGTSEAPAPLPAGLSGSTLPSAGPAKDGGPALRSSAETQLSFNDPSARTAHEVSSPKLRQSRTAPIVVAVSVALVVAIGGAFLFVEKKKTRTTTAANTSEPAAAEAPAEHSASAASSSASAAPPIATHVTTALAPSAAPSGRRAPVRAGGGSAPTAGTTRPAGAAAAAVTATATTTEKKPPPNPYANE
jgi:hypothetical protein